MIIEESDFKLIEGEDCFSLHVLKSKKELKEDSETNFKIIGYYVSILAALKEVLRFRKNKKYPGKESAKELVHLIQVYIRTKQDLDTSTKSIYDPILQLKNKLIKY